MPRKSKRNVVNRVPKSITLQGTGATHLHARRTVALADFVCSTAADAQYAIGFALSDLPSYTEFTSLFDAYRFKKIELFITPLITQTVPANTLGKNLVYSALDFDSASNRTVAQIEQYDSCERHSLFQPFKRVFCPRATMSVNPQAAYTQYSAILPDGVWIDCAFPGVPHYGFLMTAPQQAGNAQTFNVTARYELEFVRTI